jgi:protein TonB
MARENGIEGSAIVQFTVMEDGKISDVKLLRDPGGGCGKEAMRIVKMMNKPNLRWTPGKQRGKPVRVKMNMPVRFRLN